MWRVRDPSLTRDCAPTGDGHHEAGPENKMTTTRPESWSHHVYLVHGTQQRFISKLEFIVKLKLDMDHQHALINPNLIKEIMNTGT